MAAPSYIVFILTFVVWLCVTLLVICISEMQTPYDKDTSLVLKDVCIIGVPLYVCILHKL